MLIVLESTINLLFSAGEKETVEKLYIQYFETKEAPMFNRYQPQF